MDRPLLLPSRLRRLVLQRATLCVLGLILQLDALATTPLTIEPALANSYREGVPLASYSVSEKYDGVRALWTGKKLYSRQGLPIQAPPWFTQDWPALALDGELWAGRGNFDTAQSVVARGADNDERWRQVRYMVFDAPKASGTFQDRLAAARSALQSTSAQHVEVAPQWPATSHQALMEQLRAFSHRGAEGLMLRRTDTPYRAGRSDDLLKLKLLDDAEAVVIAHVPGKGKYANMTGALKVATPDGRQFQLGSGLSDAQRHHPPPVGSTVTYRFNGYHASGLPRFARFWRIRDDEPQQTMKDTQTKKMPAESR